MDKAELNKIWDALDNQHITQQYYLVYNRSMWESEGMQKMGYSFTKEELDAAEKLDVKLIGTRNGVKCYLYGKL